MTKTDIAFVQKTRKKFGKDKEEKITKYINKLFKDIPNIKKKELKEIEKWAVELWKKYKKV